MGLLGQLNGSRSNTAGCSGDEHGFTGFYIGAMQHVFRCRVGARERRQFDIRQIGTHRVGLIGTHGYKLRKAAVAFGANSESVERPAARHGLHCWHDDAFADAVCIDTLTNTNDAAANIRALYQRKVQRRATPGSIRRFARATFGCRTADSF